ncbi:PPE domain-containing protein [Nocardia terpenica]|uniref:PPE domain-containing protein n=1 Tax=Nocardia terpenica TaxID=455432 RepID=A0A6G9YXE3_9NOCA|nr:PPE domain-containing protein [Nocardia terpenica]QIS17807.1 PPE domain-containing protein [Nocardia terpenica]
MVEPPFASYTGVVWEARPTEQLARDLTTGPGAVPLAEAGAAWGRVAASFGAAVGEYDQVIAAIRDHWRSAESEPVLERLSRMRDWLIDAATAAGQNAVHAGNQAAAYEVARLAMPHVAEIAVLEAAKKAVEQAAAALGAPIVAAAAQVSADQDQAKANAARVMRAYEAATEPLAQPWQQQTPPALARADALEAERAGAQANPAAAPTAGGYGPMGVPALPSIGAIEVKAPLTAYRTRQTFVRAQLQPETTVESGATQVDPVGSRMMPAAAGAGAAAPVEAEHTPRAGAAPARPGEGLEIEAGIDVAPAVLGATAPPPDADAPRATVNPEQTP